MVTIYISTDSNEVREILEPIKPKRNELIDNYIISQDRIKLDGIFERSIITNILMRYGREIQKGKGLSFNPMSIISGDLTENETGNLVKRLVKEGLFIAISNNKGKIKHYIPDKYDGCQGGFY